MKRGKRKTMEGNGVDKCQRSDTGICANVQVLKKSSDRLLLVETVMSAGCC